MEGIIINPVDLSVLLMLLLLLLFSTVDGDPRATVSAFTDGDDKRQGEEKVEEDGKN